MRNYNSTYFLYDLSEILKEKYGVSSNSAVLICNGFLRAFRKCPENVNMDLDEWRHLLWSEALGVEYQNLADEIYPTWLQLRYTYLAITPEIKLLLNKLHHNFLLGLITNGPSNAQWEKINILKLREYFDVILVSGDLPWEKPNPRVFQKACECLGVEPRKCIMVGDKIETDILGGIQAKLGGTVWVPLNGADIESNRNYPDYIVQSVIDLPSLLPKHPTVPVFRRKVDFKLYKGIMSMPDLEDYCSNSSDGS
ncbi:hypothetical protein RN001_000505 [Aquatica leii]|uniref:N-acylneuraminate-9-phosphatase n=1 Tax=Aquatica leii TaxID=1421715 RepID=A0AAN7SKL5_9COLE|nr:hypothetical protein RN001_000505 [Aquatica leii]